jgi:quercetin dioxygenase-like cupin family protein
MTTRFPFGFLCFVSALVALWVVGAAAHGPEESIGVEVTPLLATALAETPDRHASLVLVTLQPGGMSPPHRHPGTVIVYVLEGTVESALDDGASETFTAGETWQERPGALHRVSKNTGPSVAKLLALLIHGEGDPLTLHPH